MAKLTRTKPKEFIPVLITLETIEDAAILLAQCNDALINAKVYVEKNIRDGEKVFEKAVKADTGYKLYCALEDELRAQGYYLDRGEVE